MRGSRPAAGSEEEEHGLLVELTAKARRVLRCCKRGARTDEDLAALMAWAKTTSALSQMPEEEMAKICQDMYLRPLQLGEPLFYQSQRPDAFCVLMSGVIGFYCLPESEALDKIDEVKRVLKKNEKLKEVPVIVMSTVAQYDSNNDSGRREGGGSGNGSGNGLSTRPWLNTRGCERCGTSDEENCTLP